MYSLRVATTDDREAPLAQDWPGLSWDRLCDVLRIEISPEAAALLAEPVPDPARGLTHWHIVAVEDPKPLHALSAPEREKTLASFRVLQERIRAYADRLSAAGGETNLRLALGLRIAVDLDEGVAQLWSVAGAPLLTGWGRRRAGEAAAAATIVSAISVADASGARSRGRSFVPGWTRTAVLTDDKARSALLSLLPWLLFWILVAAIGYRLLPACGMSWVSGLNYCVAPTDAALEALRRRNEALRDGIFQAEKQIAETCAGGAAASPSTLETRQRAEAAHLQHGRFEVTLAWEGRRDLDLIVYCPSGRLYYSARGACGGELDHDANSTPESAVDHPLEHATWAQDPPTGEYRIVVSYFDHSEPVQPVPFTVLVRSGDDEKTYTGVAREYGKEIEVVRLTR